MNRLILILLFFIFSSYSALAEVYQYEIKLKPKMYCKDLIRGKAQITFRKYYKDLLKENTIESSKTLENIHSHRQLDMENAFKHVFVSAKLTYVYGSKTALKLGYKKELSSFDIEIKNFGGKIPAFLDTNCDLWNNDKGIEYALKAKKEHKSFKTLGRELFDNITSEQSDFIIDYKTDPRRWVDEANADNILEIIKGKTDELKTK